MLSVGVRGCGDQLVSKSSPDLGVSLRDEFEFKCKSTALGGWDGRGSASCLHIMLAAAPIPSPLNCRCGLLASLDLLAGKLRLL